MDTLLQDKTVYGALCCFFFEFLVQLFFVCVSIGAVLIGSVDIFCCWAVPLVSLLCVLHINFRVAVAAACFTDCFLNGLDKV